MSGTRQRSRFAFNDDECAALRYMKYRRNKTRQCAARNDTSRRLVKCIAPSSIGFVSEGDTRQKRASVCVLPQLRHIIAVRQPRRKKRNKFAPSVDDANDGLRLYRVLQNSNGTLQDVLACLLNTANEHE